MQHFPYILPIKAVLSVQQSADPMMSIGSVTLCPQGPGPQRNGHDGGSSAGARPAVPDRTHAPGYGLDRSGVAALAPALQQLTGLHRLCASLSRHSPYIFPIFSLYFAYNFPILSLYCNSSKIWFI